MCCTGRHIILSDRGVNYLDTQKDGDRNILIVFLVKHVRGTWCIYGHGLCGLSSLSLTSSNEILIHQQIKEALI
jgi:hypothetical protein